MSTVRPDLALFSEDALDFGRVVTHQLSDDVRAATPRAAATSGTTVMTELKALRSGLDGVVDISLSPSELGHQLDTVRRRTWTPRHREVLEKLGGDPDLLTRGLAFDDEAQRAVADLVAYGLTDEQISDVLRVDVQQVRNRIGEVLRLNALAGRTQIAVVSLASRKLPLLADE